MGKISAMTALTGTGAATGDKLPIVDVSAGTSGSKAITMAEFLNAFGTVNAAGTALTGAGTATNDQYPIWDVSATQFKYQTAAELLQATGVTIAAASALTGANHAVGDLFFVYDLSATAVKSVTAPEMLNVWCSATINATAMTTGFHATQDFLLYSDNGVAKSITIPYLADALNALVTTTLTGANTATDDTFIIWDLSATTSKSISRAELEVAMRNASIAAEMVTLSGATSITAALHGYRTGLMTGTGSSLAQTLPAASGTGVKFRFVVGAVNTSKHVIKVANASDTMFGQIDILDVDSNALTAYPAMSTDDTITLNGTTTGGQIGDWIEVQDIATNKWAVTGKLICPAGSNVADPLSATV